MKTFSRLQDGETAVFAGLLKEDEQKSLQGIWGLSDIPVIGKLLGNSYKKRAKTDVILTVRSVLLRAPELTRQDVEAFDPSRSEHDEAPFEAQKVPAKPAPAKPAPSKPEAKPVEPVMEKPVPQAPEAPKALAKSAPAEPVPAPEPKPAPVEPTKAAEPPAPKPEAKGESTSRPKDANLILFCSPLSTSARKGERVQFSLLVSGGQGITNGSFDLSADERLKLVNLSGGDFLTTEGGSLEHKPGANSRVTKVTFKRAGSATESGTLALLEFEVVGGAGNAPVLILDGKYLVGPNPIPAKVMNALVTVE